MENKVTGSLNPDSIQKIADSFTNIRAELPFLITLTPAESKRLMRMEAGRADFVSKAAMIARENAQLVPQFFELEEMEKDLNLCQVLDVMVANTTKLLHQLQDTRDQAGHEAYNSGLEIYATTKRAMAKGIPGAQVAYNELSIMFEGKGRPAKPEVK